LKFADLFYFGKPSESLRDNFQLCSRNPSLAHTFASAATKHLGCRPSLRLMVWTYIRKGGHGGDRSKACLIAGYWQEKGGRASGAAAKAAAKASEAVAFVIVTSVSS